MLCRDRGQTVQMLFIQILSTLYVKKTYIFKITKTGKPLMKIKCSEDPSCWFCPGRADSSICGLLTSAHNYHIPHRLANCKIGVFDMEHTYFYSFINRFTSKQLKVLTHKNSSNRILVLRLALDI